MFYHQHEPTPELTAVQEMHKACRRNYFLAKTAACMTTTHKTEWKWKMAATHSTVCFLWSAAWICDIYLNWNAFAIQSSCQVLSCVLYAVHMFNALILFTFLLSVVSLLFFFLLWIISDLFFFQFLILIFDITLKWHTSKYMLHINNVHVFMCNMSISVSCFLATHLRRRYDDIKKYLHQETCWQTADIKSVLPP